MKKTFVAAEVVELDVTLTAGGENFCTDPDSDYYYDQTEGVWKRNYGTSATPTPAAN